MSAEATRDPQIAAALDHFDATLRGAIVDWLTRSPETGGHGLPPDVAHARALILQCLVEGLKVRETREPNLARAPLEQTLREFVPVLRRHSRRNRSWLPPGQPPSPPPRHRAADRPHASPPQPSSPPPTI